MDEGNTVSNMEEINELRAQIAELKKSLHQTPRVQNPACILQKDTSYDVWRKLVENDFRTFGYLYLIDRNEMKPTLTAEEEKTRSGFAMGYLISRLDDEYKRLVCDLNEPIQVLEKLDTVRRPKIPSTKFLLKRSWSNITYLKGKESATEFITRFEEATRNLMRVAEDDLKEDSIVENFLMAIYNSVPEVVRRYDAAGGKISLNELKSLMINAEASETEAKARCSESESTMALNSVVENDPKGEKQTRSEVVQKVCYRCGKPNHMSFECKSKAIICYNCKELTTNHNGRTCKKRKVLGKNRVGYEYKVTQRGRRFYKNVGKRGRGGVQLQGNRNIKKFKKIKLAGGDDEKPKYAYIAMDESEMVEDEGEANAVEVEGELFE
ncbi:uncharacterized protein LOC126893470 [Diabrotica virgifera virgifera]|uniref:CCHC-type domain-containing protein n=1 Tax=Diabrotica virgifera virgifera TaxID=50390 RepID=A0ABM5LB70_DIAVI|nr:uncharacterized protein LOC126893470 [Diabrotica virgifera virgifera]